MTKDENLTKVKKWAHEGWPIPIVREDVRFKPYFDKKDKMTVSHGLLYWGHHLVVPEKTRTAMLQVSHDMHEGICSMKVLAHSSLWYPHINQDIENLARI